MMERKRESARKFEDNINLSASITMRVCYVTTAKAIMRREYLGEKRIYE